MTDSTPAVDEASFDVEPVMECHSPPDWPGARWVGSIDRGTLSQHSRLKLRGSAGYERAKLLVRDGSHVLGFVDVDAPGGVVDGSVLAGAVGLLPEAPADPAAVSTPSITVVVCTRDRLSLLRESLGGILRLDYPNFNVIVVDNAPRTPDTCGMVRDEFPDPRVRLVQEVIPGLAQARNTGLRHARGDIVAFTDDDTVVDPAWLREIAAGFERAPDVACVTGLVPSGELRSQTQAYFDGRVSWSANVKPRVFSLADPPADLPMFPFTCGAFGTGANFALDRRIALGLGGFDTALGAGTRTGGGEDIDMFTRVILGGHSLVVQPSAIVWHRHRDDFAELRSQARAYGNGLGAWITKILMNPRTARMALARSPHAVRRLLAITQSARGETGRPVHTQEGLDRTIAGLGKLELVSVARGPINYLCQRAAGKGVIS